MKKQKNEEKKYPNPYNSIELRGEKEEETVVVELTAEEVDVIRFSLLSEALNWERTKIMCEKEDKPHYGMISGAVQKAEVQIKKHRDLLDKISEFMEMKEK